MAPRKKSQYLVTKFGHGIDQGFTSIPNLLLDHALELGISDKAQLFIIHVLRAQDRKRRVGNDAGRFIDDTDIKMSASAKTMYRIRKELKALTDGNGKHLIKIDSFYTKGDHGHVVGNGTLYDFRPLIDHLLQLHGEPTGHNDRPEAPPTGQNDTDTDQIDRPEDIMTDVTPRMTDIIKQLNNFNNYTIAHKDLFNRVVKAVDINMSADPHSDILLDGNELIISGHGFPDLFAVNEMLKLCGLHKDISVITT